MERLRERLKDALKEQNLRRANVEELNKKITKYEEINKLFVSLEKIRQTGKELEARQVESKERRQQIENALKADKVLVAEQQNLRQQQAVEQSVQAIAKMEETLTNNQEMFETLKTQLHNQTVLTPQYPHFQFLQPCGSRSLTSPAPCPQQYKTDGLRGYCALQCRCSPAL